MRCQIFPSFFFSCPADYERDWPPCKVVFFGLATNCKDSVVDSGVCGGVAEFDTKGIGVLSTRGGWKGHTALPLRHLAREQS